MNKAITVIFAILLTACGSFDAGRVAKNFSDGYANGAMARAYPNQSINPVSQQVQQYGTLQPAKTTDQQCMSRCLSAQYQYGFCQKNCSY